MITVKAPFLVFLSPKKRKEKSMKILSPAGSLDALKAAVKFGADAVYLGLDDFNARTNAKNFTSEELIEGVKHCHKRGVEVFVALNTLIYDSEIPAVIKIVNKICKANADGVIIQDWGVFKIVKEMAPRLKLVASTQMTVNNIYGVKLLQEMGFDTVVLPRELSKKEISDIINSSDINVEVFCHGALCVCYSGQCYFSSFIGERSGNRGRCAQPCRLVYEANQKKGYLLSPKDLSLIDCLSELREIGVDTLKIEGRLKSEYYTSAVTDVYKRISDSSQKPTEEDYAVLNASFMRGGYTQGYFKGIKDKKLFNFQKRENPYSRETKKLEKHYDSILRQQGDFYKSPMNLKIVLNENNKFDVSFEYLDNEYNFTSQIEIQEPLKAPVSEEKIISNLNKTGNEPFYFENIEINLNNKEIFVPISEINGLRREISLYIDKIQSREIQPNKFTYQPKKAVKTNEETEIYVTVKTAQQIKWVSEFMKNVTVFAKRTALFEYEKKYGELPNVGLMCERIPDVTSLLADEKFLKEHKNITKVFAGNVGTVEKFKDNYEIYGDFTLNVSNTLSCEFFESRNVSNLNLSVELNLKNIKNIACDNMKLSVFAYGHIPLMITESCLKSNLKKNGCDKGPMLIKDRKGEEFILDCEDCTKNVIYNPYPVMMADKTDELRDAGINCFRLHFTYENKAQVEEILHSFKIKQNPLTKFTRGHFYRGAL